MMKRNIMVFIVVLQVLLLTACRSAVAPAPSISQIVPNVTQAQLVEELESVNSEQTETAETTQPTEATEMTEPTEHEHAYTQQVVEATCTEDGYSLFVCDCGDRYRQNPVNAFGHQWSAWETTQKATESREGSAERICATCGAKETKTIAKDLSNHTHQYQQTDSTAATCSAEGINYFTCSCGAGYTESVAKTGHNYTATVVEPSCHRGGYTLYTCSGCGASYQEAQTDKLEHDCVVISVIQEAQCNVAGKQTVQCTRCRNTFTQTTEKTPHQYVDEVVEPTCRENGYTVHTCNVCGSCYSDQVVEKLEHDWSEPIVAYEASCEQDAYVYLLCNKCNYSQQIEGDKAYGHKYYVGNNTATCTEPGELIEYCENGCYITRRTPSPATGHTETYADKLRGTCTRDGYEREYCRWCDALISEKLYPAIGEHTFETADLASAAIRYWEATSDSYYMPFCTYYDWRVEICQVCDDIDHDSLRFAYTDYEAALIMLGYVNELRESVYGTDKYNLVLDSGMLEIAKVRAEEISINFCHVGIGYGENICGGSPNIYSQFMQWYNSPGHYENMIYRDYKYFAYALYTKESYRGVGYGYGVQLFGFGY